MPDPTYGQDKSILNSVKKVVGISAADPSFDDDLYMHINSVFATLNQLGIGPQSGFFIEDDEAKWSDFLLNDPKLNSAQTYMYLKVRLIFDPVNMPGHLVTSMQEQIRELEWRLNVRREETHWAPPA